MAELNFKQRLLAVQNELKCNKSQYNSFGRYNYRSCEDILEASKPICLKYGILVTLSDTPKAIGDRYYIEATARAADVFSEECLEVTASARESETKKGMDDSQITGTASSYARKYALGGLFDLDDNKDADTNENALQSQSQAVSYACADCGAEFEPFTWKGKSYTAKQAYEFALKKSTDGKARCRSCLKKMG